MRKLKLFHLQIFLLAGLALVALPLILFSTPNLSHFADWSARGVTLLFANAYEKLFGKQLFTFGFWIVLAVTLILQRLFPAVPDQKTVSKGMMQDLVWFIYEPFFSVFIYGTYILWFKAFYTNHLGFLTVTSLTQLPDWARFAIAIFLLDFLNWFQHVLHHKNRWLWSLHSIHHSQSELNFFSAYRFHILEFAVRNSFLVFPFLILDCSPPEIVAYAFFEKWYAQFYHGNIRSNLGPLKYLLVTPQSHRVHHSKDRNHYDKNFGALFSIWDRLFGTVHKDYDTYPETGIPDKKFPLENSTKIIDLLITPFRQLGYSVRRWFLLRSA